MAGLSTRNNSDTNASVNASPHRLRAQSHRTAPHFICQSQVVGPQATHNFCLPQLQIRGSHDPLLGLSNLIDGLTAPRKTVYLVLPIYYKGYFKGCK